VINKLRELSQVLEQVSQHASTAREATASLTTAAAQLEGHRSRLVLLQQTSAHTATALSQLGEAASSSLSQVESHMGFVVATASSAEQALRATSSKMTDQAAEVARVVPQALAEAQSAAEAAQGVITTRLDDLQNAVADHRNLWSKAVSEMIDAVKIGAIPIHELLSLYGDAQIGGQRLSEYLKGLNLNYYRDHVRELVQGLNEGTVEIARVQEYLGQTQLIFAKQLTDIIDLFKQGSVTLKRVEEVVRQVQKAFPDSELSDLADALYQALKKGGPR
jgi:DNA-binding ferritin-like protein (Dps family)